MKCSYVVESQIRELGIVSSVVCEIHGIDIQPHSDELETVKARVLQEVVGLDESALAKDPVLEGYRQLVARVGRSAKKFPPAAAGLIELIRRTGRFPTINVAVDSYNISACRTRLAIGAHDLDLIGGTITFRSSPGGEPFRAVGSSSVKQTAANDYVYADDSRVLAWLDSKDSDDVKLTANSKNVLLVIQGTPTTPREYNRSAIEGAASRIVRLCGGKYEIKDL